VNICKESWKNRDPGSPETVVIRVGTNDLRRTANLHYEIRDVHSLVNKVKPKCLQPRLVLSGVLRRRDVS
jgi:hypothetical protein